MTVEKLINELKCFDKDMEVKINAMGLQHSIDYLSKDEGLDDKDIVMMEIIRMSNDI